MITPKTHINGTAKDELIQQMMHVAADLNRVLRSLAEARPNGRDYYHTGNLKDAQTQHNAWEEKIDAMLIELERWMEVVDLQ